MAFTLLPGNGDGVGPTMCQERAVGPRWAGRGLAFPSGKAFPPGLLLSWCGERSGQTERRELGNVPKGVLVPVTKDCGSEGETQGDRWGSPKEGGFGNQRCLVVEGATSYGSEPQATGQGPAEAVAHPHSAVGGASPSGCGIALENAPQIPSTLSFCRGSRASWETSLPGNAFALHPWK